MAAGPGLAKLVALEVSQPSVTFASPGLRYTSQMLLSNEARLGLGYPLIGVTLGLSWGFMGIIVKKMETTRMGDIHSSHSYNLAL